MLQQLWQWFLEPANQRICSGIIAAFIIGLIVGSLIRYRKEKSVKPLASKGDNAFFKGIRYLLSNDRDQAIEEFTKSVQVNSDTIETYMALGNLYRSRGDIDRAIRIRQTIILRPNIDEQIKLRALFDLGLDYRKGGFIMPHKEIPRIAATLQVAFYASYLVPEYKDLNLEERRNKVAEDYITSLKLADVIFEKAKHEKLPPDQERIMSKYLAI